jgi:hypothetical protein
MKIFSMRKTTLFKVAIIALLGIALHGCKKPSNGIDNNEVVTKPYSLFVADSFGVIYHTNDAVLFKNLDFSAAGQPPRAIATSGNNLFFITQNIWVRVGQDKNFNAIAATNHINYSLLYQNMILNVPSFKRIYLAGDPGPAGTGVYYSDTDGAPNTWVYDNDVTLANNQVTSFTQLEDGTVVAFSDANNVTFTKNSAQTPWVKATGTFTPATAGKFFITHLKNTIVAVDAFGANDVYYSSDKGQTWQQYANSPKGLGFIFAASSVFEQALLVGTEGSGIYRLSIGSGSFVSANTGLPANAKVTGITQKYLEYKNGQVKQYVFVSTNKGIFRSEDLGLNWVQVVSTTLPSTNFTAIY